MFKRRLTLWGEGDGSGSMLDEKPNLASMRGAEARDQHRLVRREINSCCEQKSTI